MKPWQLRIFGRIELLDPFGKEVLFPTRRVCQVLAMLSQHRRYGQGRDEIAEAIWPDAGEEQRLGSLRQALTQLRKTIGSENVVATLATCRLSGGFDLETDIERAALRRSVCLSPELDIGWLDHLALGEADLADSPSEPSLCDQFYSLLLLIARLDPGRALGMMRENLVLTHGLSPEQMRNVCNELRPCGSGSGWLTYFSGYVRNFNFGGRSSTQLFRRALDLAQLSGDRVLSVQASVQLSFAATNAGRLASARQFASRALEIAGQSRDPNLKGSAYQSLASVEVNCGRAQAGFELYQRAAETYTNPIDSMTIEAIHRYYRASFRRSQEFEAEFSICKDRQGPESGHALMGWFAKAAQANATAHELHPLDALPRLIEVTDLAEKIENSHLTVFSLEALARAFFRADCRVEGEKAWQRSRALRTEMSLAFLTWDLHPCDLSLGARPTRRKPIPAVPCLQTFSPSV